MDVHEIISASVISATAVTVTLLERRFPCTPGQKLFRRHFLTDWLYYSIAFGLVMGWLCHRWIIPWVDHALADLSQQRLIFGWPVWTQLLLSLFAHDLFIYWFHRWMHANKYLWRIHEPHHSAREVDWAAGSRAHVIEAIILTTAEFGPLVILGAAPQVALYKGVIDAAWGMFIHANLAVKLGWLNKIINGPQMHRWHHSRDVFDVNFATKFAFWDWIFGTAYLPKGEKPQRYGIEIDWPRNILTHQLLAFRPFSSEPAPEPAKQAH